MKIDHTDKLNNFVEYLKNFPEIIGIAFSGSTATSSWDEFSDLDIDVVSKDKDYKKLVQLIPKFLSWWGEIKFYNNYGTWDETYGFIGKEFLKVEIEPIQESYFKKPNFDIKNIKIVYDKFGILEKGKKNSQKLKHFHLIKKDFVWSFLDMRSNFLYVSNHYARGQKVEAISQMDEIRNDLFKLLGKTKQLQDWEFSRNAERIMSKKEFLFWKESRCNSNDKKDLIKAIKTSWKFMKYVESEFEKKSNEKLNLNVDDEEILNKIINLLK